MIRLVKEKNKMKLIQTYVFHKDRKFFISTINRLSSAADGGRYAETMVWDITEGASNKGELIGQTDGGWNCISTHLKVCADIYNNGKMGDD